MHDLNRFTVVDGQPPMVALLFVARDDINEFEHSEWALNLC
jgi:hypothetical protein